jgi:hypothetical protein
MLVRYSVHQFKVGACDLVKVLVMFIPESKVVFPLINEPAVTLWEDADLI